jgi:hypothetical protein
VAVWKAWDVIIFPVTCQAGAGSAFGVEDATADADGAASGALGIEVGDTMAIGVSLASRLGATDDEVAPHALSANDSPATDSTATNRWCGTCFVVLLVRTFPPG